jgi:hypothetical protein
VTVVRIASAIAVALLAMLSASLTFAQNPPQGAWFLGFRTWVEAHSGTFASLIFLLAVVAPVIEGLQAYLLKRHENKEALQSLVDDFARKYFEDSARKNRITLFKATMGWRLYLWSLGRALRARDWHKIHAALRIKWAEQYLGVYVRATDSRNPKSSVALRISDNPNECEGLAGRVWEDGWCFLPNLPAISREQIGGIKSFADLEPMHPVRIYAEATHIHDITVLKSMQNFARHFIGFPVRRSEGKMWGVLLLDSDAATCPFPATNRGAQFGKDMKALTLTMAKLIK